MNISPSSICEVSPIKFIWDLQFLLIANSYILKVTNEKQISSCIRSTYLFISVVRFINLIVATFPAGLHQRVKFCNKLSNVLNIFSWLKTKIQNQKLWKHCNENLNLSVEWINLVYSFDQPISSKVGDKGINWLKLAE